MKLQFGTYINNLCWLAKEGEIDRNPGLLFITYLFVLIPNRRIIAFWNRIPLFICLLSPSLTHSRSHLIKALHLWWTQMKSVTLRSFAIYCIMYNILHTYSVKIEPAKSTSKPAIQLPIAVEWHCEKPQKSCAHHNVLTVF